MERFTTYRGQQVPTDVQIQTGEVRSMRWDTGEKLGVSLCFTRRRPEKITPAERERNRAELSRFCRERLGKTVMFKKDFPYLH